MERRQSAAVTKSYLVSHHKLNGALKRLLNIARKRCQLVVMDPADMSAKYYCTARSREVAIQF